MKSNGVLVILLLVLALVLGSCTSSVISGTPVETVDTPETVEELPVDSDAASCAAVTCPTGQTCKDGQCGCADDEKLCGDACVDQDACCLNDDCEENHLCDSGSCVFDCSALTCGKGRTCDANLKKCVCPSGYKWCEQQEKCIPVDHCCSRFDCRRDERCIDTITSAEICVENGARACKIFNTVGKKTLSLPDTSFDVTLTDITFLESIDLVINDENLTLAKDEQGTVGEAKIYIQKFRELGGECRDFERNS